MDGEVDVGYLVGVAKRKWRDSKKITTYEDTLTRDEGALFKEDDHLVELCLELKSKEQEIIDYIDTRLRGHRWNQEGENNRGPGLED